MTATTTTTTAAAVVLILPLVLATCGHAKLTDDAEHINNYGSCPLVKRKPRAKGSEADMWEFDMQPCGYPYTGYCTDMPQNMRDCNEPFPDTNIYHKDETVIATYSGDPSSAPCPLNLTYNDIDDVSSTNTQTFDCPVTCYDCANLCR